MIDDTLRYVIPALTLDYSVHPDKKGRLMFRNDSCRIVWRSNKWILIDNNKTKFEFNDLQECLLWGAE